MQYYVYVIHIYLNDFLITPCPYRSSDLSTFGIVHTYKSQNPHMTMIDPVEFHIKMAKLIMIKIFFKILNGVLIKNKFAKRWVVGMLRGHCEDCVLC